MTLALAICGADDEERALLEQFCKAAAAEWTARLRPGIAEGSCEEALTCAAAVLEAQAQALMEPYIRDDRFCFRGVPG